MKRESTRGYLTRSRARPKHRVARGLTPASEISIWHHRYRQTGTGLGATKQLHVPCRLPSRALLSRNRSDGERNVNNSSSPESHFPVATRNYPMTSPARLPVCLFPSPFQFYFSFFAFGIHSSLAPGQIERRRGRHAVAVNRERAPPSENDRATLLRLRDRPSRS